MKKCLDGVKPAEVLLFLYLHAQGQRDYYSPNVRQLFADGLLASPLQAAQKLVDQARDKSTMIDEVDLGDGPRTIMVDLNQSEINLTRYVLFHGKYSAETALNDMLTFVKIRQNQNKALFQFGLFAVGAAASIATVAYMAAANSL